jgi:hypothetical protein
MMADDGRELDLYRDVADLAILDRDKRPVGRVDDIEFDEGDPPTVVAFLAGAPSLADRFSSRLRGWIHGGYARLDRVRNGKPTKIPVHEVSGVNVRVDLRVARDDLGVGALDRWLIDVVIGKIPGADHAPE